MENQQQYIVVIRGQSGVLFTSDGFLPVENFPVSTGRINLVFRTRYTQVPLVTTPIPRGLFVEVHGPAKSIDEAIEVFTNTARAIAVFLSFSTNAPIGELEPEIAFDNTPGLEKREFFQQFLPDERIIYAGRKINVDATLSLMQTIADHPRTDRIHRAISHYHFALHNWKPGRETFSMAHLYIGFEALTPIALDRYLLDEGISKEELIRQWEIEARQLAPEIRRRILFQEDNESYQKAKRASDGYEHSYMPFDQIHYEASEIHNRTAHYLRQAIIELGNIKEPTRTTLLSPPFDKPFPLGFVKYIHGHLIGNSDDLAAEDQAYPFIEWRSRVQEVVEGDSDIYINTNEDISPKLNKEVNFQFNRIEIWGGPPQKKEGEPGPT